MTDTILPPFTVTRAAIAQIEALGGALRIDAEPGGCSGTSYVFHAVSGADAADADRYGCPGAWLFVGAAVRAALPGATLDYAGGIRPPRFRVINNPNTPDTCPCRRSFGSPWPGPGSGACRSYLPMPWDTTFDPPARWNGRPGTTVGRSNAYFPRTTS